VKEADELPRLPPSTGGLLGFAMRAWAANAPLYLALQLGVFAAYALAEWLVPAAAVSTPQGQFKVFVLIFTGIFADAFVVTAVAMGVAARGADTHAPARALVGVAIDRWLPVIAVNFLAQYLVFVTTGLSGLGPPAEPRALQYAAAPIVWIFWGILGLAAPFVALGADRRPLAVIAGFSHAFSTSLRRGNLLRLCVLALVTVLPMVLQAVAYDALVAHHGPRPFFWANIPIDAITIGPVAAVQTAFALDFARRAGDQRPSAP
jgi:hypothetical protein